MRGFFTICLICFLLAPLPAQSEFILHKKDYAQNFLNNALNAEKRDDRKSAFQSFEKALYHYPKDKRVIITYAKFCERQKYFDRAEQLYQKLYILTKDRQYLFKKNLCTIKNGKISEAELKTIAKAKGFSVSEKKELNFALIYHFSYKNDWANVEKTCEKLTPKSLTRETIQTCIVASEKTKNKKNLKEYYFRFSELYPKDSEIVNKIITMSEASGDFATQEKFIKKLSDINPNDNGIKYQLAGFYEKHGQWAKAAKVYEGLMVSGDKSEHVKKSYDYVMTMLNPVKIPQQNYAPKPLTGYKLQEKLFYEALDAKKYSKALLHLNKMLKDEPTNTKLLKHKADIAFAQNNYKEAINLLEKINTIKPISAENKKFLAFLYSKENNYPKAIEIIETMLQTTPGDESLLKQALEYTMATKNRDKAIIYTDKLLVIEPHSERYLENKGNLLAMQKDFANAISTFEKLVEYYPVTKYKIALVNLYMGNQEFDKAQALLEPLYKTNRQNPAIVEAYLNTLLAQKNIRRAYWVIRTNHLEQTRDGYMVMGDMDMMDKNYDYAKTKYRAALDIDPDSLILKNKLANAYRMMGYINGPTKLFQEVLAKDPDNLEAKLGLGSLEIDKKNPQAARQIFYGILDESPTYRPAKIAIAHSYIADNEKINAVSELNKISQDDETILMKGQAFYDMHMWSDSKRTINPLQSKDANELKYKIERDNAITLTPSYTFFYQKLADEFKLDYHKFGLNLSKNIDENTNIFMAYNVIVYSSGGINKQNNVVNEFKSGVQSRPNENWEYRADLGVKAFEFGGGMIITDSWIKRYLNDKTNIKLGYKRDNIEQSYLSAVGTKVDGIFTGRACDNKYYVEIQQKLPNQFYAYGLGSYGFIYASNLITNQYFEGMIGAGKNFYDNPKNKWLQTFAADLVSYNSSYQYNLLKIYSNTNQLYGGYFSPSYFNATTLNLKAEGDIKKWRLKYGIKGFGGVQTAISSDLTRPTWGFSPYITYDINDNITINVMYDHFNYADLTRDVFMINAVIRGF